MISNITIYVNEKIHPEEINSLLSKNKWEVDVVKLQKSISTCWRYLTARDQSGNIIGFVQALSDEIMHVYVFRMIVHPDHRKKGVGTRLMNELMAIISEHKLKPTLVATPGNEHFYEKFGFKRECNGVVAMCIR